MTNPTILEMAANVRQMKDELDDKVQRLKADGHDWADFAMASDESMQIATDGLKNAYRALNRLRNLALILQRLPAPK